MRFIVSVIIVLFVFTGCKNKPSSNAGVTAVTSDSAASKDSSANQNFFPVPEYIGGELKMIDSLQLPLSMSVTINKSSRSTIANDVELRRWAANFQQPDISDSSVKRFYTETNIADQSIPSVTLIYATADNSLPVQKINVFIKPDPSKNDKVTGIYIEKLYSVQDTLFNQKLYWKTGKNLQVTTEKKVKGITLPVEQVKITWDPS